MVLFLWKGFNCFNAAMPLLGKTFPIKFWTSINPLQTDEKLSGWKQPVSSKWLSAALSQVNSIHNKRSYSQIFFTESYLL